MLQHSQAQPGYSKLQSQGRVDQFDRIAPLCFSEREIRGYSLARAVMNAQQGVIGGFERDCSVELATRGGLDEPDRHTIIVPPQILVNRRDLTVAAAGQGGYLVDTEIVGVLDALRPTMRLQRLGAQVITGLRSGARYVRQGGTVTTTWQAQEGTQATETSSLQLGDIALSPKTVTAYIESSHLIGAAVPLMEGVARNDLRRALLVAVEQAAFNGSGSAGQPTGILNTSGIGSVTGTSLAYDDVLEFQSDVLTANALSDGGEVSYLCRPAVAALLANRQGFSTADSLWTGALNAGRLAGCPAFSTMNMPAETLLGGDFTQMAIAEWGAGLVIKVNPYTAGFAQGITSYCAYLACDVALLAPAAFSVATSVT